MQNDRPPLLVMGPASAPPQGAATAEETVAQSEAPASTTAVEHDPYPGLRPFRSDESDIFFGREAQTDEMIRRLKTSHFLAVVGTSGCGKSSLVRAGLIAALETGLMGAPEGARWRFALMRPGGRPMHRLSVKLFEQAGVARSGTDQNIGLGLLGARLRCGPLSLLETLQADPLPGNTNLLVVVDQFEEIFRFRREGDINEADAFVALLLASAGQKDIPIFVVLTMRSDFIGECAVFDGLPEAINESQYLTPRLSREQRQLAIIGPARSYGGDIAPDLLTRLLNETGTGPDQLPVLQHLLMRMWTLQRRSAPKGQPIVLTMRDYHEVGGLEHALSRHADEIYCNLGDDRRRGIAEVMFRRLSERPNDLRRPTDAIEIAVIAGAQLNEVASVADAFRAPGANFLMPEPGEAIENKTKLDISHESLIKRWTRLRDWSGVETQMGEAYRELVRAAMRYKEGKSELLNGLDLQQALLWRRQCRPTPEWAARYGGDFEIAMSYLSASEMEANRKKAHEEAARRKALWFWRGIAATFFLMFVISVLLGSFAVSATREAMAQRARVIAGQARFSLENSDWRLAMLAVLDVLPGPQPPIGELGDMLRSPFDPDTRPALREALHALMRSPFDMRGYATLVSTSWDVLRSPVDAKAFEWLRPVQPDAMAVLEEAAFRPIERMFRADKAAVTGLAVSGDAGLVVVANENGTIQRWRWNNQTGWESLPPIPLLPLMATTAPAATAREGVTGAPEVKPARQQAPGLALSPDGRFMATITDSHQATIWDALTGKPLVNWKAISPGLTATRPSVASIVFNADSQHYVIVTGSYWSDAIVWDWSEAEPRRKPKMRWALEDPDLRKQQFGQRTHKTGITTMALSGDGGRVVTGSWDGTAKIWEVATGNLLYVLENGSPVRSARFSPVNDGRLVTADNNGSVRLWCTHPDAVAEAEAAPKGPADGDKPPNPCVSSPRHRPVSVLKLKPQHMLGEHDQAAITAVFDPRGERIASAGLDGKTRLWDVANGVALDVLPVRAQVAGRHALVAFYDDQRLVASFSDSSAFLLAAPSSRALPVIADLRSAAIDAQNRRLATVAGRRTADDADNRIDIWNLADASPLAKPVRSVRLGGEPVDRVAFSPDGSLLMTVAGERVDFWMANVWRLSSDDQPLELMHPARVTDAAFDSTGEHLVTASVDGKARIWDLQWDLRKRTLIKRTVIKELPHADAVVAAAFDASARHVATVTKDGTAWLWRWNSKEAGPVARISGVPVDLHERQGTFTLLADPRKNLSDRTFHLLRAANGEGPRAWTLDFRREAIDLVESWLIDPRHQVQISAAGVIQIASFDASIEKMTREARLVASHRLAEAEKSRQIVTLLPPPRDSLTAIIPNANGGWLAALYGKGRIRVLRLPGSDPASFIRFAREVLVPRLDPPYLAAEEREALGLSR